MNPQSKLLLQFLYVIYVVPVTITKSLFSNSFTQQRRHSSQLGPSSVQPSVFRRRHRPDPPVPRGPTARPERLGATLPARRNPQGLLSLPRGMSTYYSLKK